ncbi:MAG: beta-phosphoglucomutase family hydrolase [Pseudomonadota bacterium]|nr:beta-phosphoglucomutase family hydrolase [Pseudomonadota bacterium]
MIVIPPHVKALIFDLDGTLADTMALHYEAWHEAFAAVGASCPQEFLERLSGVPTHGIVALFNEAFSHALDVVSFTEDKERRAYERLLKTQPIGPVVEVVRQHKGRLPMAIATGGVRRNAELILRAIGLEGEFDTVITADDAVRPKPSPDIFLEAARRLNVEPGQCLVFEDADAGLEAARRAGMAAIDVRPILAAAL